MGAGTLEEIYNFYRISETVGSAGQPKLEQLALIQEAGYEIVINLLPHSEALAEEAEALERMGVAFHHIPVIWTEPYPSDFEAFVAVMQTYAGRRIFVHCAANMRASVFLYLYRTLIEGMPAAEAQPALDAIWTPNPIWQSFLQRILQAYERK